MKFNKGIIKSTIVVTVFSVFSIFFNFVLQLVVAYYYGANFLRDSYFVAISIPLFFTVVLNSSLGYVFLPKFIEIAGKNRLDDIREFLFTIFVFIISVILIIFILIYLYNNLILYFCFPSYNKIERDVIKNLLIILMPSVFFNVFSYFFSIIYQAKNNFFIPALTTIISIIVNIIFFITFNKKYGIESLAYGYLIGSLFPFLILLPIVFQLEVFKEVKFNKKILYSFLKIALPLLLGSLLFRFTNVFEKIIASTLSKGNISYLGYSAQILLVLSTLTSNGIGVVIFPVLSKLWFKNNYEEISQFINKGIRIIFILTIPVSVLLLEYSDFIIGIVFQRGQFNSEATSAVSRALNFSLGAFIFQSIGSIIIKMFYISGHTKINTIISVIEVLIYISIAFLLLKQYTLVGLPIALSISSGLSVFTSILYLNKYILKFNIKLMLIDFFKILFISLISLFLINIIFNNIFIINKLLTFSISVILGFVLFVFLAIKFKINEILLIISHIMNKIK